MSASSPLLRRGSHILAASCAAVLPWVSNADAADSAEELRVQARAYEHGEGVAKDPIRAVELYCRAAAQGNADAQYDLGWIYANGRGVMRRETLAASLFELAAEQGHPQARAMLEHLPPPDGELPECMRSQPVVEYDDSVVVLSQEAPPSDEPTFAANSEAEQRIIDLVKVLAPEYKVSPLLALAIIRAESNFDASARSPKNAQGLMQLIPETSARFKVRKPYDPVQNLRGGLAYLRWLLAYFRGDVALVAAAYNAGERAVERYRGIPPYAETREYVRRILSTFRRRDHPFDPAASEPSPELSRIVLSTSH